MARLYDKLFRKMLSLEEVKKIAKLANLTLTEEELLKYRQQLSETLDYIKVLDELDTTKIAPTFQVTGLVNSLREDVVKDSLSQAKALSNAKETERGYFVTDRVLNL